MSEVTSAGAGPADGSWSVGKSDADVTAAEPRSWAGTWRSAEALPWKDKFRRRNLAWKARAVARMRG